MIDLRRLAECISEKESSIVSVFQDEILDALKQGMAAESGRDELKVKLAEIEAQKPAKEKSRKYDASQCCDVVVIEVPVGFPIYARPIPPQPIANNSEPVQRITEQDACEIIKSWGAFHQDTFEMWCMATGKKLLDKLNEHREHVTLYSTDQFLEPRGDGVVAYYLPSTLSENKAAGYHERITLDEKLARHWSSHMGVKILELKQVTPNKAEVPVFEKCEECGDMVCTDVGYKRNSLPPLKGDDK